MAMTYNNTLPLSSKHAFSFHTNLYRRSKTLQFSPLKLETLKLSSRTINNVCLNFHTKAWNPFDEWKSKSASILIASCLILVGFQRPALPLPPSPSPSVTAIQIEEIQVDVSDYLLELILFCLSFTVFTFCVFLSIQIPDAYFTSIFTIQVGLEVGDDVHRDLTLISKVFDQYTSVAWKTVLEDTVEVLDWHRSKLKFAYSSGRTLLSLKNYFESISYKETKKFNKKRPLNLRNSNAKGIVQKTDGVKNNLLVVTILLALNGWHKLPTVKKKKDLNEVFKKLKSYSSKLNLKGLEIVWAPKEGDKSFTLDEVKKYYPLMTPL